MLLYTHNLLVITKPILKTDEVIILCFASKLLQILIQQFFSRRGDTHPLYSADTVCLTVLMVTLQPRHLSMLHFESICIATSLTQLGNTSRFNFVHPPLKNFQSRTDLQIGKV